MNAHAIPLRRTTERSDASDGAALAPGMKGLRVLVVEDEFLLACSLEDDLHAAGHAVVGPFSTLARGLEAAARNQFDFAILDVNLNGEMVFPLADHLLARRIPLLFLSGYGAAHLPERFRTLPRMAKPYEAKSLLREIGRVAQAHR